jgi:NAD(P)H-hydrate epimerase
MNREFRTDRGVVVPAVTTEQMREVDRIAMEETGPNLYQMMENAGRNLATVALEMLGDRGIEARILVLAGSGGNGGGGICAARHLANRGVATVLCMAEPQRLSEIAKWQHQVFSGTRGKAVSVSNLTGQKFDLIVDALIGYSLKGAPSGAYADLIGWANSTETKILSLDVPSGLDSTTGAIPGLVIRAEATVTLALPKIGLIFGDAGRLLLGDIGIPFETYRRLNLGYFSPFGSRYVVPLHLATGDVQ